MSLSELPIVVQVRIKAAVDQLNEEVLWPALEASGMTPEEARKCTLEINLRGALPPAMEKSTGPMAVSEPTAMQTTRGRLRFR